jgi:hypothetical protein
VSILYALDRSRRVSHLLLFATWIRSPTHPSPLRAAMSQLMAAHWQLGSKTLADYYLPDAEPAAIDWFARLRAAASRGGSK